MTIRTLETLRIELLPSDSTIKTNSMAEALKSSLMAPSSSDTSTRVIMHLATSSASDGVVISRWDRVI
jgi:hypothetical protein